MPNISSYGTTASGKKYTGKKSKEDYKKSGISPMKKKTAGSSAQATMRRQQADLKKRLAQRKTSNKRK